MSERDRGGTGPVDPGPGEPSPVSPGDDPGLEARVRDWMAGDPSPEDRAELEELLAAVGRGGAAGQAARAELAGRFAGRLEFGTAGLRGAMGAGPNRMNRAVVLGATAALARWLHAHRPDAAQAGVVLGWDARHHSAEFAQQAAAALTGAGIPVHLLPDRSPTPLLAFAVRHLGTAAGVMITASHNPPADNGYKLYLGDGAQIIPPVDAQIEDLIRTLGPLAEIPLGPVTGPLVTRHGDEVAQAYLDAIVAASPGLRPAADPARPATPASARTSAIPAAPASAATPATSALPAAPASAATPATSALPAAPASAATPAADPARPPPPPPAPRQRRPPPPPPSRPPRPAPPPRLAPPPPPPRPAPPPTPPRPTAPLPPSGTSPWCTRRCTGWPER